MSPLGLSKELVEGVPDEGTFESMPRIRHVAGSSTGPRVQDKVVIVVGCNSPHGIGRAAVHQFAQNGAKAIYLCDYTVSYMEMHKRELASLYPAVRIHYKQMDVTDEGSVKDVVDDAMTSYGRVDIMFANAGIINTSAAVTGHPATFSNISPDQFLEMLKINTLGVFLCAKHAATAMLKTGSDKQYPGGSIIASASVSGMRANAGSMDYAASKAAVISIAQTMAYQLAGTGVRVNAVCPGITETDLTAKIYETARANGSKPRISTVNPVQRGAVPDEIARMVLFLGSDEASYLNGQAVAVCGGLSAGHPS